METGPCPQCRQGLTQVGQFWICPRHGQVSPEKLSGPLRIFLSYGHDNNEDLVRCIKADLRKRGHDVWFDRSEIKSGDDWRHSITDGILKSNRVLSFLSKHSNRDPGVCRDEIAIALGVRGGNIQTILVESEQDVKPPVNIGHIQWLDMHEWKERRAAGGSVWEEWYQAKLAEIVRVVESDESRRFAGEIEMLNGYLKPIKFEARIGQLLSKGFYGRQWLFEAVEKWRLDTKFDSRLFWIMGAPGVGKSAFAAQLTHTRGDTVIAAQFCEWDKPDHRNAPRVVRSLAFQIATRLPDYRKFLLTLPEIAELDRKDAAELFDYLLANPLRSAINAGRERFLIVIDALDEASEAGRNVLVEMLARNAPRLPDWLGLVVTSRPEFDVKNSLQALNPFPLDTTSESNRADIADYMRRELAPHLLNRPNAERLVDQILEKSEGVFLYVERLCDDVRRGYFSLDRPEQFPQGLGGTYFQYCRRQFPDLEKYRKNVRPAVSVILAAHESLPVEILRKMFGWHEEEERTLIQSLGSLFSMFREGGTEVIKPYHKSLADWLVVPALCGSYFIDINEGQRQITDTCWAEYKEDQSAMSKYSSSHLPVHLAELGRWDDLLEMMTCPELGLLNRWIGSGEIDKGMRCLIGLLESLKKEKHRSVLAAGVATQIARLHSIRGAYDEAEQWLDFSTKRVHWWKGRRIKAIAFHEIASLSLYRRDFFKAERAYRRAWFFCMGGIPVYRDEAAANLIGLSTIALGRYSFKKAVQLASMAIRTAKKAGDVIHRIAGESLMASAYKSMGRYTTANIHLQIAFQLCDHYGINIEKARLLLLEGWLKYDQDILRGHLSTAAGESFEEALRAAEKMNNTFCLIEAKFSLGWQAIASNNTADAEKWIYPLAGLMPPDRHLEIRAGIEMAMAAIAHQHGKSDAAGQLYHQVCSFCGEHDIRLWHCRSLVGLGAIHWHEGKREEAATAWKQALRLAERISAKRKKLVHLSIELCRTSPTIAPR